MFIDEWLREEEISDSDVIGVSAEVIRNLDQLDYETNTKPKYDPK